MTVQKTYAHAGILPTETTARRMRLRDKRILIFGPPKIGKSVFCAGAEKVLFLATEPGLGALEVYQVPITTWEQFLTICAALEAGDHTFEMIVIDTVENLLKLVSDAIRRRLGIEHESDAPYGKGFGLVNDELHRVLTKLSFLPYGLILVSHSEDREIETRTGKVTRTVPSLPEKTRRLVLALVDIILYADLEETRGSDGTITTRRILHTKPSPRFEAGDRTGLLPEVLPLDFNAFRAALEGTPTAKE